MKKACLYFIAAISMLSSCSNSSTLITSERKVKMTSENISIIEGRYQYSPIDTQMNVFNFWSVLKPFEQIKNKYRLSDPGKLVEIKILDKKWIEFYLYSENRLISTKKLNYKIKDNVIVISCGNNTWYEGIPLLFYRHQCINLNLGINKENDLIIKYQGSVSGGIFLIIFGDNLFGNKTFKRIESKTKK